MGLVKYSFLSLKSGVDAKTPVKPKERAYSIPLLVPISTILESSSHAWKKGLDQL